MWGGGGGVYDVTQDVRTERVGERRQLSPGEWLLLVTPRRTLSFVCLCLGVSLQVFFYGVIGKLFLVRGLGRAVKMQN